MERVTSRMRTVFASALFMGASAAWAAESSTQDQRIAEL